MIEDFYLPQGADFNKHCNLQFITQSFITKMKVTMKFWTRNIYLISAKFGRSFTTNWYVSSNNTKFNNLCLYFVCKAVQ